MLLSPRSRFQSHRCDPAGSIGTYCSWGSEPRIEVSIAPLRSRRVNLGKVLTTINECLKLFQSHRCDPAGSILDITPTILRIIITCSFNRTAAIPPGQSAAVNGASATPVYKFQSHRCDPAGSIIWIFVGWLLYEKVSIAPLRSRRVNRVVVQQPSGLFDYTFQSHRCDPAGSISHYRRFIFRRADCFNRTAAIPPGQSIVPSTTSNCQPFVCFPASPCCLATSLPPPKFRKPRLRPTSKPPCLGPRQRGTPIKTTTWPERTPSQTSLPFLSPPRFAKTAPPAARNRLIPFTRKITLRPDLRKPPPPHHAPPALRNFAPSRPIRQIDRNSNAHNRFPRIPVTPPVSQTPTPVPGSPIGSNTPRTARKCGPYPPACRSTPPVAPAPPSAAPDPAHIHTRCIAPAARSPSALPSPCAAAGSARYRRQLRNAPALLRPPALR